MAPGKAFLSVGIQPQIALYSVILGTVCSFGWYSEKYRRDEGDLDGHIQKLYPRNVQEQQSKIPQINASIRGQSMDLDGSMNKMVWGGKAQMKPGSAGGNATSSSSSDNNNNDPGDGAEGSLSMAADDDAIGTTTSDSPVDDERRTRKRRKRKRKKPTLEHEAVEREQRLRQQLQLQQQQQQKKLVLQSSIAGVALGAVTVAAVSVLFGGVGGGRK